MRLIDADELMATLSHNCYPVQHDMTSIEPGMTLMGMLQAIQEQPTIEPQRWIPLTERPMPKGLVLVTYNDGDVDLLSQPTAYKRGNIVAWMPLPIPYIV